MVDENGGEEHATIELLQRARSGDREAWERLYERYEDDLRSRIRSRMGAELRSREESLDILQSLWVEAITGLPRFEYQGEKSLLAWMTTVLHNKLATRIERSRSVKRDGGGPAIRGVDLDATDVSRAGTDPGPSTRAEHREELDLLKRALGRLAPDQQELVRWAVFELLPLSEVARRVGVSEGAARMRVARAKARLTQEFLRLGKSPATG